MVRRLRADASAVRAPTLHVRADHDRLVPVGDGRAFAAAHGWEFHAVADCGHAIQIGLPERLLDLTAPWIASQLEAAPSAPVPPSV